MHFDNVWISSANDFQIECMFMMKKKSSDTVWYYDSYSNFLYDELSSNMNISHALSPCGTREDYEKDKPKKINGNREMT